MKITGPSIVAAAVLALGACASHSPGEQVSAVVQDEAARAAAVTAAQQGEGSRAALEAGAAAAGQRGASEDPPH